MQRVEPEEYITCTRCEVVKHKSEFHRSNNRINGLHPECRQCKSEIRIENRKRLNANPFSPENQAIITDHMVDKLKSNAKSRGLTCTLTGTDLLPLPKRCPVLEIPLKYMVTGTSIKPDTASVDRIDNDRGYEPDNVQIVSLRANVLKRDASIEELESILAYMKKAV